MIGAVAQKLGVGTAETVRKWIRQAATDAGQRPGTTSEESAEVKRAQAGERRASPGHRDLEGGICFLRGRARPALDTLVKFIAGTPTSSGWVAVGVEPICRVLSEHGCPIAPSTYYDALARSCRPSARDVRDEVLKVNTTRAHRDNYGIYGARKVRLQLNRDGIRPSTLEEIARLSEAGA